MAKSPNKSRQGQDFSGSLEKLEALVEQMESGELSLEDSLEVFEQGIKLTRQTQKALTEAEQKIQLLLEENNQLSAQPFKEKLDGD